MLGIQMRKAEGAMPFIIKTRPQKKMYFGVREAKVEGGAIVGPPSILSGLCCDDLRGSRGRGPQVVPMLPRGSDAVYHQNQTIQKNVFGCPRG